MPHEEGVSYQKEGADVTCQYWPITIVTANETTTVIGFILDAASCFVQYFSYTLIMAPVVPNVITPNEDSINDIFLIGNLPPNSSLTILNRWENQVYQSKKYDNSWDVTRD